MKYKGDNDGYKTGALGKFDKGAETRSQLRPVESKGSHR